MNNIDNLNELLEKEIRVQNSINTAKKAYESSIQKQLENEVRVQTSIRTAYEELLEALKENPPIAASKMDDVNGELRACVPFDEPELPAANITHNEKSIPIWKYAAVAASILLLIGSTWQYDSIANEKAGKFGLDLVASRGVTTEIDLLIKDEKYDDALVKINEELSVPFDESKYSGEALSMAQKNYNNTQADLKLQKASVLLLQGKKSEAKEILKGMNNKNAELVLDKLFFLW